MKFKLNIITIGFDDNTEIELKIVHNYNEPEFDARIVESFVARTEDKKNITSENLCEYIMKKNKKYSLKNDDDEPLICFPYSDIEKNIVR